MCGFVGYYAGNGEAISPERFAQHRDRLVHRGPDQGASFHDRGLSLGFRRLAILDLSAAGHQPMQSADQRWTIVFNGEIYNFEELRASLIASGVQFRSHSDTEVLLALLQREGPACLPKLNGMFAFAAYDADARTLLLARDRLGVKPLFVRRRGARVAFGSELRALRGLPGFSDTLDPDAIATYFQWGSVPEWTSVLDDVEKLPPGHYLQIDLHDASRHTAPVAYWDLPPVHEQDETRSESAWVDDIESLLWDATRIRLRADVPLGVFLSGGIDSGLVTAAAAAQLPGISSFTVGFAGESEDETPLAAATARRHGVNMVKLNVDVRAGLSELADTMAHFDEPFADTSALPTSLICREARKHLTVVLTGDAGDESFAGYGNHVRAGKWQWLDRVPRALRTMAGAGLAAVSASDSVPRRFAHRLRQPVGRFGMGSMLYPFEDWQQQLLRPEFRRSGAALVRAAANALPEWSGASAVDLSQRVDLRTYMLDDILVKVDRMSMRHSIELRSPFLDYRMVELGLRVPSALRVKNGQNKYLLRKLAERHLPSEVCNAPKRGFGIPLHAWLREPEMAARVKPLLIEGVSGFPDPFVAGGAERLWNEAMSNRALQGALIRALAYRWWCVGQSGGASA